MAVEAKAYLTSHKYDRVVCSSSALSIDLHCPRDLFVPLVSIIEKACIEIVEIFVQEFSNLAVSVDVTVKVALAGTEQVPHTLRRLISAHTHPHLNTNTNHHNTHTTAPLHHPPTAIYHRHHRRRSQRQTSHGSSEERRRERRAACLSRTVHEDQRPSKSITIHLKFAFACPCAHAVLLLFFFYSSSTSLVPLPVPFHLLSLPFPSLASPLPYSLACPQSPIHHPH